MALNFWPKPASRLLSEETLIFSLATLPCNVKDLIPGSTLPHDLLQNKFQSWCPANIKFYRQSPQHFRPGMRQHSAEHGAFHYLPPQLSSLPAISFLELQIPTILLLLQAASQLPSCFMIFQTRYMCFLWLRWQSQDLRSLSVCNHGSLYYYHSSIIVPASIYCDYLSFLRH